MAAVLLLSGAPVRAQVGPQQLGVIEGTGMTRDEFRGRALAQLCAIALNALAYHLANGEYPPDYARLRGSEAWNLEVSNLFTGGRLRDIFYDPERTALTTAASQGFAGAIEMPLMPPPPPNPAPSGTDEGGAGAPGAGPAIDLSGFSLAGAAQAKVPRVDPKQIKDYDAGELLYYAKDDLLQLVIFAPDGTYVEWVDDIPRPSFREALSLPAKGVSFPADLYAKQVLYYVSELLPEYYNLVRFMSDQGGLSPGELARCGAQERLAMALELGIRVLNPLSHAAASASADPLPGDLAADGPPLGIRLQSGVLATLAALKGDPRPWPKARPAQAETGKPTPPVKGGGKPRPGGGRGGR